MAKPLNLIQSLNQLKAQLSGGAAASDEALILIKSACSGLGRALSLI